MNTKPGIFRSYRDLALFVVCLLLVTAVAYAGVSVILRAW